MPRPGFVTFVLYPLIAFTGAVQSGTNGDTNLNVISADTQCLSDLAGSSIACSGTDVSVTLEAAEVLDGCDYAGDKATIIPAVDFSSDTNARHDLGLFLATDGGNALTGVCKVSIPPEAPAPFADLDSVSDPSDQCGDIEASTNLPDVEISTLTLPCLDSNGNGTADIGACVAWANTSTHSCLAPSDSVPVNGSRCNCLELEVIGLTMPLRTVEVIKLLSPESDAGIFDLTLDSVVFASSVGDLGSTGPVEIALDDEAVIVGETGASGTSLSGYVSSIECTDQVGRCSLDANIRCTLDSACSKQSAGICNLAPTSVASCSDCTSLAVPIPYDMATIACTITNTAIPTEECDDGNDCTIDALEDIGGIPSCSHTNSPELTPCGDPDATACNAPNSCNSLGQCIDRVDAAATLCRSSASQCDTPEFCDGVSKNCPEDAVVPPGDECLLFRDGFENFGAGMGHSLFNPQ